eukprot:scaffold265343_cov17-Tisochrysis_lutea.AAC.1
MDPFATRHSLHKQRNKEVGIHTGHHKRNGMLKENRKTMKRVNCIPSASSDKKDAVTQTGKHYISQASHHSREAQQVRLLVREAGLAAA